MLRVKSHQGVRSTKVVASHLKLLQFFIKQYIIQLLDHVSSPAPSVDPVRCS